MRPLPFRASPGVSPYPLAFGSLMRHHDEELVNKAFECLLGRKPEPTELADWVSSLRSGQMSRSEAVVRIRYSSEGRGRNVFVPGMALQRFRISLTRLPVLGYLFRWVLHLLSLPMLAQRLSGVENGFIGHANMEARYLDQHLDAVTDRMSGLANEMRQIEERMADRENVSRIETCIHALFESVSTLETAVRDHGMLPATDPARFDAYYRRFEDRFRGLPETIRERLKFYVPILQAAAERERGGARFVDLGCGRGELVKVLSDEGLAVYGVDRSDAMLDLCRESGLLVQKGDAIEHLTSLPPNSVCGLTAIHLIEHLPFPRLLRFFSEAFRVLRPGGVGIFETPNPENLIVGACNFYFDPTHMRPLPPEPTRFVLESVGFERVSIERLHPGSTTSQVTQATDPVERIYSAIMLVPQDYALIAYKPVADAKEG